MLHSVTTSGKRRTVRSTPELPARIGIFGGTFDPPHLGHLEIARRAVEQLKLDALYFVPAKRSPLKQERRQAGAKHRAEMVRLLASRHPAFHVSTVELRRPGISFTVDTLRSFHRRFPDAELILIIGEDNLRVFSQWRSPETIARLAALAVYRRTGSSRTAVHTPPHARVIPLRGRLIPLSSTQMRDAIAAGKFLHPGLVRDVVRYIRLNGLYEAAARPNRRRSP